jgi:F0F1-type ATP synthase membrane subunit b/b'
METDSKYRIRNPPLSSGPETKSTKLEASLKESQASLKESQTNLKESEAEVERLKAEAKTFKAKAKESDEALSKSRKEVQKLQPAKNAFRDIRRAELRKSAGEKRDWHFDSKTK